MKPVGYRASSQRLRRPRLQTWLRRDWSPISVSAGIASRNAAFWVLRMHGVKAAEENAWMQRVLHPGICMVLERSYRAWRALLMASFTTPCAMR